MKTSNIEHVVGSWINYPNIVDFLRKFAPTNTTILITGETGVGKGALTNLIVSKSKRKDKKFIDVNCGAIPETLLETSLFGHVKGSFTSAVSNQMGLFEEANGGTIFLDEITETSLNFQTKLLKVLENKSIRKIGDSKDTPIDVRLIVATNKNLAMEVSKGDFRQDLFYRLNLAEIKIPPLRERLSDIPILTHYFLKIFSAEQNKPVPKIAPETMGLLLNRKWQGNVRELKNAIEYAVIVAESDTISLEDFPEYIREPEPQLTLINNPQKFPMTHRGDSPVSEYLDFPLSKMLDDFTKQYLISLLMKTQGNILEVSKISEMDRTTIYKKLKQFGIDLDYYRSGSSVKSKFATTFDRIEKIIKEMNELDYQMEEGETINEYKKRVENLHSPFISKLEGVRLEWRVPDYSDFPEELIPENKDEEIVYLNTSESPVNDLIKSVMSNLSIKISN